MNIPEMTAWKISSLSPDLELPDLPEISDKLTFKPKHTRTGAIWAESAKQCR
jgi:hypothetical protein